MAEAHHEDFAKMGKELYTTVPEHPEPVHTILKGTIPEWLSGSLIRVGPGKYEWGKSSYRHWFDGQAVFHCFNFQSGNVTYRSQYLQSRSFTRSKKYGRVAMTSFGTWAPPDPCKNIFARIFSYFLPAELSDNANINVVDFKDGAFSSTETPYLYQIDPKTGDTLEEINVENRLWGLRSWSPHPHTDNDGNAYNFSTSFLQFKYQMLQIPPKGPEGDYIWSGSKILGEMHYWGSPAYFHSFGMTENYFILIENPLLISNFAKILFMNFLKSSYLDLLKWYPNKPSKIHIIDRHNGKNLKTFTVETFFAFHHVNAYETANDVIVDVCGYPDTSIITAFYLYELRDGLKNVPYTMPSLRRYRLPLPTQGAKPSLFKSRKTDALPKEETGYDFKIIMEGFELPRINYAMCNAKKYTYAYGIAFPKHTFFIAGLVKVNVDTGDVCRWEEDKAFPSEPVFVPTPGGKAEDDGVILSAVCGVLGKKSFLLVLDASTFTEIGRAEVPYFINPTLHGSFWNN